MIRKNGQSRVRKFLMTLPATGALFGVYCLAIVGVSSLTMAATDTSAQAKGGHGGGGHGGGHHGGGHHGGGHGGGHHGGGHHGGGHHGHFFHDHAGWVHGQRYWWGGGWYCWYGDGWNGPGWYVCGDN